MSLRSRRRSGPRNIPAAAAARQDAEDERACLPQHQARLIQKLGSNDRRAAEPARDQRPGGPSPLHSPRRRAVFAAEGKERLGGRRPSPLSFFTFCPPEMRDRLTDQVMCSLLAVRIATGFYFLFASVSSNIRGPDNPHDPAVPHVPFICGEANRTQGKQSPLGIHGYGRLLLCSGDSRGLARELELALAAAEAGRDTIAGRSDRPGGFEPPCVCRMHETNVLSMSASCQLGRSVFSPRFPLAAVSARLPPAPP